MIGTVLQIKSKKKIYAVILHSLRYICCCNHPLRPGPRLASSTAPTITRVFRPEQCCLDQFGKWSTNGSNGQRENFHSGSIWKDCFSSNFKAKMHWNKGAMLWQPLENRREVLGQILQWWDLQKEEVAGHCQKGNHCEKTWCFTSFHNLGLDWWNSDNEKTKVKNWSKKWKVKVKRFVYKRLSFNHL